MIEHFETSPMRFDGSLEKWNDDRGFGFIKPTAVGDLVFVHISAFPRDGRRPRVGEPLSFEVEPAGDGKKRAVSVRRAPAAAPSAPRLRPHQPPAKSRRGNLPFLAGAAVVVGLAVFTYTKLDGRGGWVASPEPPLGVDISVPASKGAFRCDGRIHCSQMTSCEEATFFLRNCPGTKMDGDGDGIPCERQWCPSR